MHNEANFIGITILRYPTRRVSHPRYRLLIVAGNVQPSNLGFITPRFILETSIKWFVNLN